MAENKKSFILYADLISTVSKLPDDIAGKLLKLILEYVNDKNPAVEDLLLQIAFEPIKQQLKRDLKRWTDFRQKQSLNGQKGGRPKKPKPIPTKPKNPGLLEETQKSLNVNANVNANVNESDKEEKIVAPDLSKSNLFREPNIPTKNLVLESFLRYGGTKEMAKTFFENYEAVGWYARGSPITNFNNLIPKFIENWERIDSKKDFKKPSLNGSPPLRIGSEIK